MATQSSEKILLVEGSQDKWFFEKFIQEYCPDISIAVVGIDESLDGLKVSTPRGLGDTNDGKQALVRRMKLQLQSLDRPMMVGAILDADYIAPDKKNGGATNTLNLVKNLFTELDLPIKEIQEIGSGYIFKRQDEMPASGLWLMDNQAGEGQFEDWLIRVMDENEKLNCFREAEIAVSNSTYKKFKPNHTIKANVLTWLAWQRKPDAGLLNLFKSKDQVASIFNESHDDFHKLKVWLSTLFSSANNKK